MDNLARNDVKEERIPDVPWYKSCRMLMAFISAWGYVFFYLLRIDLSMAIVCMVKDPNITTQLPSSEYINNISNRFDTHYGTNESATVTETPNLFQSHDRQNLEHLNITAVPEKCSGRQFGKKQYEGELEWNKALRGYVLSSFFYGYIVTQVPGGWLAGRYGGKLVFGYGVLVTVAATLLVPIAARTHAYLLIVLRIIMGMGCGVGFPATHHLYGRWIPPNERSRLVSFSHAGTFIGTIIALSLSGILCDSGLDNGWPLIFYVYGAMTFGWWFFWQFLVYSSPDEHPRIDPIEKNYIIKSIGMSAVNGGKETHTPWLQIMKSPPVWAIIVAHSCSNWSNYTILTCIPMYMQEVLRFDIKQNGALSALPYILSYFSAILCGQAADFFLIRKLFTMRVTRKVFQCLSSSIPALLIVLMGFMDCDRRYIAVVLLCLTLIITSFCRAGFAINHLDLSPRYAGILFGISNTAATVPGMVAPTVVGILTPNGTREEWLNVFIICAALFIFSTVIYGIFADGEEQSWANPAHPANVVAVKVDNLSGLTERNGNTKTQHPTDAASLF